MLDIQSATDFCCFDSQCVTSVPPAHDRIESGKIY